MRVAVLPGGVSLSVRHLVAVLGLIATTTGG